MDDIGITCTNCGHKLRVMLKEDKLKELKARNLKLEEKIESLSYAIVLLGVFADDEFMKAVVSFSALEGAKNE